MFLFHFTKSPNHQITKYSSSMIIRTNPSNPRSSSIQSTNQQINKSPNSSPDIFQEHIVRRGFQVGIDPVVNSTQFFESTGFLHHYLVHAECLQFTCYKMNIDLIDVDCRLVPFLAGAFGNGLIQHPGLSQVIQDIPHKPEGDLEFLADIVLVSGSPSTSKFRIIW